MTYSGRTYTHTQKKLQSIHTYVNIPKLQGSLEAKSLNNHNSHKLQKLHTKNTQPITSSKKFSVPVILAQTGIGCVVTIVYISNYTQLTSCHWV